MSKELTPLEALTSLNFHLHGISLHARLGDDQIDEYLDIIEKALKDYESLQDKYDELETEYVDQQRSMLKYDEVKDKKFKALEIIKENCKIYTESSYPLGSAKWWHVYLNMQGLVSNEKEKEQFDLLKEVLL